MKDRVHITLSFSADLDMIPGWGHQPEDWVQLVTRDLNRNSHYNTEIEVHTVETGRYTWSDEHGYLRPVFESAIENRLKAAYELGYENGAGNYIGRPDSEEDMIQAKAESWGINKHIVLEAV